MSDRIRKVAGIKYNRLMKKNPILKDFIVGLGLKLDREAEKREIDYFLKHEKKDVQFFKDYNKRHGKKANIQGKAK